MMQSSEFYDRIEFAHDLFDNTQNKTEKQEDQQGMIKSYSNSNKAGNLNSNSNECR